eukprot:TRINITY_DN10600_c1_g1_i1.p1 TRINITY_DN10600_c1_g1~~TRINITY_DN10600_c1_g1_i1.p1  ORF type:complete len:352 (+),score=57.63 TRINITY_DN10600_c1_g1_i1:58-1113(+)
MYVVIAGGQGFLGQELARFILKQGKLKDTKGELADVQRIILFDAVAGKDDSEVNAHTNVTCKTGDMTDPAVCRSILADIPTGTALSVFHLAGVMSGAAEKDFDLGLRVNLDGTRNMLDACRALGASTVPKFIFTSSLAVFGETYGPPGSPTGDTCKIVPKNTYGMTKACCELLVNDYSRKGFIDGRTARLPTVIVRPGLPNAATTSCYSGVVREPLHGVDVELPIARDLPHAVTSTRALITNLVKIHDVAWPDGLIDRAANLPSRPCTLQDLIDALHAAVPPEEHKLLGKIGDKEDKFLSRVVSGMGSKLSHERAQQLGMVEVPDLKTIVQEFLDDFGEKTVVSNKRRRVA